MRIATQAEYIFDTCWDALNEEAKRLEGVHLFDLLAVEADRFKRLSFQAGPLLMDCSKQHLSAEGLQQLIALAKGKDLQIGFAVCLLGIG